MLKQIKFRYIQVDSLPVPKKIFPTETFNPSIKQQNPQR